jgi:undecaprenyl diphosphate synthase
LADAIQATQHNTGLTLILALSYSGRWEILQAARQLAVAVRDGQIQPDQINEALFSQHLTTGGIPDPELMIRTSGEMRISNFMLWQLAYSELYMPEVLWPDFRKKHLYEAILSYQQRERRFGKTSEQLTS